MLASDEAELADLIAACRAGKLSDVAAWIEAEGPLQIDPVVRGRCDPSAALDRLSQWTRRGVWAPYERCQQPSPARAVRRRLRRVLARGLVLCRPATAPARSRRRASAGSRRPGSIEGKWMAGSGFPLSIRISECRIPTWNR
jgi:hypothetical protein